MLPDPKEDNLNPRLIGTLLLILSLVFLVMGGMSLFTITSTYYFNGENTVGTVKNVERNKWPRFRTFTYELEYRDATNTPVKAYAIAAGGTFPGDEVEIIYAKNNPEAAYFNGAYLPAIGYDLGTVALGLFVGLFGLNQFFTRKPAPHTPGQPKKFPVLPSQDIGKTNMPPAIKIVQNFLIILLLACLIGYLISGSK